MRRSDEADAAQEKWNSRTGEQEKALAGEPRGHPVSLWGLWGGELRERCDAAESHRTVGQHGGAAFAGAHFAWPCHRTVPHW
jgi:hypothetical protein